MLSLEQEVLQRPVVGQATRPLTPGRQERIERHAIGERNRRGRRAALDLATGIQERRPDRRARVGDVQVAVGRMQHPVAVVEVGNIPVEESVGPFEAALESAREPVGGQGAVGDARHFPGPPPPVGNRCGGGVEMAVGRQRGGTAPRW